MKKRFSFFAFLLLLSIIISSNVVYADSVDDFITGNDDLLVLATITDIVDNSIVIEPFSCLKNRIDESDVILPDTIKLNKFRYYYCNDHAKNFNIAKIGDNIIISLAKHQNNYSIKNGVYKTDTVDMKNIRILVPVTAKGEECEEKLVSLSYYLSTGCGNEKFIYQNGTVKVNENGVEVTLYPSEKNTEKLITYVGEDGKEISGKREDVISGGINLTLDEDNDVWIYAMITIVAGLFIGFVVIASINKFISHKKQ